MLKVLKYSLGLGLTKILMPKGAEPLDVAGRDKSTNWSPGLSRPLDEIALWAIVDEKARSQELRMFRVVQTGVEIPEERVQLRHVGTCEYKGRVMHVFEVVTLV